MKHIKNFSSAVIVFVTKHKIVSVLIVVVLVGGVYYVHHKTATPAATTSYILGTVERGTIISSVSGTGQMSSENQVDIQPKVSGDIVSVPVVAGQKVTAGAIIATLDSRDAALAVRDAYADLVSARISLAKAKTSSTQTKNTAAINLTKSYDDAFSTLTSVFANMSSSVDAVDNIFTDTHSPYMETEHVRGVSGSAAVQQKGVVVFDYQKIKDVYQTMYARYRELNRTSHPEDVQTLVVDTYTTAKQFSDVLKEIRTFVTLLQTTSGTVTTQMTTDKTTLDSAIATANSDVASLLASAQGMADAHDAFVAASETYTEVSGSHSPLDVQTAELAVTQKENAYQKALNTLSDYTIRAPFDGIVAVVNAKIADSASSGAALATLITTQKIATISLNEVDVAQVKIGQKVTLTFDAIPDFSLTGSVLQVDALGTVSQGVVNYSVKIGLDTQDERVRSGMSVSATIITDSKNDVLVVPRTAIKGSGSEQYVQILDGTPVAAASGVGVTSTTPPRQIPVETGISNDTDTEIVSGLTEGEQIIVRTTTSASVAKTTTPSATSLLGGGGGGAGIRIPRN